ncbi:hypothetical protein HNY73_021013 [Argiope bruennichi]|uniref:Uncharacterized protein n=1 Tax=Argiope bruennichi TaxID=94029 RepID=A0A8T0EDD9_ARGBR|nr:hypothetical protein HNY73_021013 [Argiope bruennichi]
MLTFCRNAFNNPISPDSERIVYTCLVCGNGQIQDKDPRRVLQIVSSITVRITNGINLPFVLHGNIRFTNTMST